MGRGGEKCSGKSWPALERRCDGGLVHVAHRSVRQLAPLLEIGLTRVAGDCDDLRLSPGGLGEAAGERAEGGEVRAEQVYVLAKHHLLREPAQRLRRLGALSPLGSAVR